MNNTNFNDILSRLRESIFSLYSGEFSIKENIDLAVDQKKIPVVHIGHLQIDVRDHNRGGAEIDFRS